MHAPVCTFVCVCTRMYMWCVLRLCTCESGRVLAWGCMFVAHTRNAGVQTLLYQCVHENLNRMQLPFTEIEWISHEWAVHISILQIPIGSKVLNLVKLDLMGLIPVVYVFLACKKCLPNVVCILLVLNYNTKNFCSGSGMRPLIVQL